MEDSFIKAQLVKFNVVDSEIAVLADKFGSLTIKDIDDKEGYKEVRAARIEVKNYRVSIDKRRKELNEDALKWQRSINGEAKRLTDLLIPTEKYLEKLEKDHVGAIEAIKRAELEKAEAEHREKLRLLEVARMEEQARVDAIRVAEQARLDAQREQQEMIARQQAEKEAELKAQEQRIRDKEIESQESKKLADIFCNELGEKIENEIKKETPEPIIPKVKNLDLYTCMIESHYIIDCDYIRKVNPYSMELANNTVNLIIVAIRDKIDDCVKNLVISEIENEIEKGF